jgi:hypothetical protein
MAIKIRRGTDTARLAVIFEEGEVIYTTDTKSFFIGDGVTAGGNQIGGTTAASLLKAEVHNATGVTLTKGQVVYLNGNTGNKPNAVLAQANSEATSSKTIGLIILNISNNANGDIATDGLLSDLNTSAFVAGDLLWLSDSIAGGVTTIIPDTPNHAVFIGYVVRAHATQGSILIHIQNGYELNEIHDVKITSVQNNDGLIYDNSLGYWKNSNTVTLQGNTFNAANKLVQLDGTAKLPAIDGSQLTNLPTPTTPTLATVTTAGNTTTNAITVGGLTVATNLIYTDTVNGRVGIGTVTPSNTLDVTGTARVSGNTSISAGNLSIFTTNTPRRINVQSASGSNCATIGMYDGGGSLQAAFGIESVSTNSLQIASTSAIRFYTGSVIGNIVTEPTNERMRLFSNGNLAINTTTDAGYKLDVNGTTRFIGVSLIRESSATSVGLDFTPGNLPSIKFTGNTGSTFLSGRGKGIGVFNVATDPTAKFQVGGIYAASSAISRGLFVNTELQAAANNDVLVGLDINPTFTNGAFTGVNNLAARFQGGSIRLASISADPTNAANGDMYYNTTLGMFRVYQSGAWKTITAI